MLKKQYHFCFEYPPSFPLTFTAQALKNGSPLKSKSSLTKEKKSTAISLIPTSGGVAVSTVQKKALGLKPADLHCVRLWPVRKRYEL